MTAFPRRHARIALVSRPPMFGCRSTHPLTRERCAYNAADHDHHRTQHTSSWWNHRSGQCTSDVGIIYVTYFGRFVPHPGHEADQVLEHFPDQVILRHELAQRITYGYGTSFEPGGLQRTVWYHGVDPAAYMDVWVLPTTDPSRYDPVPNPRTFHPHERWTVAGGGRHSQRSEYLQLTTRPAYLGVPR